MDNPVAYTRFLTDIAGIVTPRVMTELLAFADTFTALLSSTEIELIENDGYKLFNHHQLF